MALGHSETNEALRIAAEQVCELRHGSSKNFLDYILS